MIKNSPYNLLQEIYRSDPWKVLVCCILLNQTTRLQVDRVRGQLFQRWPDSRSMSAADEFELSEVLRPLGLFRKRAKTLMRMSDEFTKKDWKHPRELYGLGKYADDSYEIFIKHNLSVDNPSDKFLMVYMQWAKSGIVSRKAIADLVKMKVLS